MEIEPRRPIADRRMPSPPNGLAERWGFNALLAGAAMVMALAQPLKAQTFKNQQNEQSNNYSQLGKPEPRAIVHTRGLPREIEEYRAARIDRGCLIEAIVFADWLMTRDFDGKHKAASIVSVDPKMGDKNQRHAMVVFTHNDKFYTWDMNYGSQSIDANGCKTMAEAAKKTFEKMYENDLKNYEAGEGKINIQKNVPIASSSNPLDVAVDRLNETRPVLIIGVKKDGYEKSAIATIFEGDLYIFSHFIHWLM